MSALLELHELDLVLREAVEPEFARRFRRLGLGVPDGESLTRARARLRERLEGRWATHYDRASQRYGRAIVPVRGRVCTGCYIELPRSAAPVDGETLTACVSCGRLLYWR